MTLFNKVKMEHLDRKKQKELYIEFLKKCTRNLNSANNYSDFKRINECLELMLPDRKELSILDFNDADQFNAIVERLNTLPKYIEYNKRGNRQYSNAVAFYQCFLNAKKLFFNSQKSFNARINISSEFLQQSLYKQFVTAIRTKPFLLLAGISGTGKSRIVREFAFKSCPKYLQDKAGTTPGNYCMIEVKPNWLSMAATKHFA